MIFSNFYRPTIQSLWDWWLHAPPNLPRNERHVYALGVGLPQVWLTHFLYIFLFLYWEIRPLVAINIASVLLWTITAILWRQNRSAFTYLFIMLEVCIHVIVVIIYVGWGFGMQYYLFTMSIAVFLVPWPRWQKIGTLGVGIILFIIAYYYTLFYSPVTTIPAIQLAILNIANIIASFGLSGVLTMYLLSLADHAGEALEEAYAKSEALLNNVFPEEIARRLKTEEKIIADSYSSASVLFADIVGFTQLSQQISPEELVELLNKIFSRFDELVDCYNLEKIKTIGDSYMVASGIPTQRPDHAVAIAYFALAMRRTLMRFNQEMNTHLRIRIGINTGPVVAGVIGKRRFVYDLWGDCVNVASRMESHGIPGAIQLTASTQRLLDDRFDLANGGLITVKGNLTIQTYFLVDCKELTEQHMKNLAKSYNQRASQTTPHIAG